MTRIYLTIFLIVLIAFLFGEATRCQAQTYSCQTANGVRFFTNDPGMIPPGCQNVSAAEMTGAGGLSIVELPHNAPMQFSDVPATQKEKRRKLGQTVDQWKRTAEELVSQYNATRTRLYRAHAARTKLRLRQELRDIKSRRDALLTEVAAARLPFRDRGTVEEILSAIAPD
ncbi:MAG TPA: hypothetical protein VJ995_07680 [Geothermobacteraceae bacterium]|nr:hypothetical protein [Geothermobacteraceae bacterium]